MDDSCDFFTVCSGGCFAPYIYIPPDARCILAFACRSLPGQPHSANARQILTQFIGQHFTFLQALILSLAYTNTQDARGMNTNFFFFTIPAQLVPYCMMLVTFLVSGTNAFLLQLCGLLAAHFYDFLSRIYPEFGGGPNLIPTPAFLSPLVETPRIFQRDYGTAIHARGEQGSGSGTGASTGGVLPDSWRTRGSGHRLGGN